MNALDFRCPVCNARPNQVCANEDSSPKLDHAHAERVELARPTLLGLPVTIVGTTITSGPFWHDDGCPCPCHRGQRGIRHIMPCHPDGYEPPREYEVR